MRIHSALVTLTLVIAASTLPLWGQQQGRNAATQTELRPAKTEPASITYKNTQYGFTFTLPATWKGYTIVMGTWGDPGQTVAGVLAGGPALSIRNPRWTEDNPWQDIPIMICTHAQWTRVDNGDITVSAAPIGPGELARNRKYVFALPPRFDYADVEGVEEVDKILRTDPLHAY